MEKEFVLGIDIGGTNIAFALVDKDGNIQNRSKFLTIEFVEFQDFADKLYSHYVSLGLTHIIKSIGVGTPNGNFYTGSIDFAPNLRWGEHVPVKKVLEEKFGVETVITNDANAAACGEKIYGGAKEMDDFAVITLGTGLGSGIYTNGKLLLGKYGFAGELGHVIVEENGRACGCGRLGCLETYASVSGIRVTVLNLLENYSVPSLLRGENSLSGKAIETAALAGDMLALKSFEITSEYLGKAIANFITIFDMEAIFLLGGLAQSGPLIFENTKNVMEENLMKIFNNKVKLLPSLLADADAAILGAAALAR